MNELASQMLFQLMLATGFLAGGALLAAALLGLLRYRFPTVHELVWSIVLAQAVLVFQIPVAIPWNHAQVSRPSSTNILVDGREPSFSSYFASDATNIASSFGVEVASPESHWAEFLLLVWIGGFLLLLSRWVFRYVSFIRNLPCKECDVEVWNQEWTDVANQSNSPRRPSLYMSRDVGPLLCRWPNGYRLIAIPFNES